MGRFAAAMAISVALAGCGSAQPGDAEYAEMVRPGVVEPADDLERQVLTRLPAMPSNTPTTIAGSTVVVGESYASASGRTCRRVDLSGENRPNLACLFDDSWAFVPSVVAPVQAPAPTEEMQPAPSPAPASPADETAPAANAGEGEEAGE